jgi:hypothetical protein
MNAKLRRLQHDLQGKHISEGRRPLINIPVPMSDFRDELRRRRAAYSCDEELAAAIFRSVVWVKIQLGPNTPTRLYLDAKNWEHQVLEFISSNLGYNFIELAEFIGETPQRLRWMRNKHVFAKAPS